MYRALEKKGYPIETIATTLKSISQATMKQYSSSLHTWWNFCQSKNVSLLNATIQEVLMFFQNELDTKLSKFGTFNQHRAALSLILPIDLGANILIRRFLKGVYRIRPPKPRYDVTWDPVVVINYIKALKNNDDLNLLQLSKKLTMLLALSTGHRLQTLHLIKIENICFDLNGVRIHIPDFIKTSRRNGLQPFFEFSFFEERQVCVATTLLAYIERTADVRLCSEEYLLISSKEPYRRASRETLGRWIRDILKKSGINTDIFSAHSTRHAVTSAANRAGVSWDTIRKSAGWSTFSSTFARFYNRPLMNQTTVRGAIFQRS